MNENEQSNPEGEAAGDGSGLFLDSESGVRYILSNGEPTYLTPLPDQVQQEVVWHYTNGSGLVGIIESQLIWASSPVTLNDSQEIGLGLALFQDAVDELRPTLSGDKLDRLKAVTDKDRIWDAVGDLFIISASLEGDLLNPVARVRRDEWVCARSQHSAYIRAGDRG